MTTNYQLIVRQLEDLVNGDAKSREKICKEDNLSHVERAKILGSHCQYVRGLNEALRVVARLNNEEYKPISPMFKV